MPDINKYITNEALAEIRSEIDDADGREILFIGRSNNDGFVTKVDVAARGSNSSVACIYS